MNVQMTQTVMEALVPYTDDNWDEEGATAISVPLMSRVVELASILPPSDIPVAVTPLYNGSVGLYWSAPGGTLNVRFLPDGSIYYLSTDSTGDQCAGGASADEKVSRIVREISQRANFLFRVFASDAVTSTGSTVGAEISDSALVMA